jgi:hypothetical protein
MSDSTISQLPAALSVNPTDVIPVDQGGVTKRATVSQLNIPLTAASIASSVHGAPPITNLADADQIPVLNSTSSYTLVNTSWGNIKTTLDVRYPQIANIPVLAGFQNTADYVVTWTNATRTLTIAPTATSFQFYSNDILYTKTALESISIPDVTGNYYFHYDTTGTLVVGTSFTGDYIMVFAFIGLVYWNSTQVSAVPDFMLEGHQAKMPSETHYYLHNTIGCAYDRAVGGQLPSVTADGDGSLMTHIEFSATPGAIWDEDLQWIIPTKNQTDNITVMWRTGAAGIWNSDVASSAMVRTTGTGRAAYNQLTGGAWQLTEITDTQFLLMHLFTIPGAVIRWILIMGQVDYADINAAIAGASSEILTITGVPLPEYKAIASFVIQTDNTYTNSVKSRIRALASGVDFVDWRHAQIGGAGASGTGGDVVGPVGAAANNIAIFDGATGKLIKDGGTPTAIIGTATHAAASITTPVGADEIAVLDSTSSFVLSRLTFTNALNWFAAKLGNAANAFSVAAATAIAHAVRADQIQGQSLTAFTTGGTSTAYTLTPTPAISSLVAGQRFRVLFNATAGATPTLAISGQTAKNLKLYDSSGVKQSAGATTIIANMLSDVEYDGTDYVLMDQLPPLVSITTAPEKLPSFTATQASNALTIAAVSQYMDFRNATLATGTPVTVLTGTPTNLVIPATSNLGMLATTVSNRLVILEAYNAGTPVLCVVNLAGGNQLDETNLISPTTIGASSNTKNVIYSAVACGASTPYRIIGFVDVVFTTGTGWSSPTLVQPCGGEALTAMSSFGYGQTPQTVTRTSGVTYYNTTNKGIILTLELTQGGANSIFATVAGYNYPTGTNVANHSRSYPIPPGAAYSVTVTGSLTYVAAELR